MSRESHDTTTEPKAQHGALTSYIVGFVLSLVFTLIPYYMVVNKTLEGTALLVAIIGFAIVQLIIQMVFFLHLGREKKPRFQLYFLIITVGAIMAVVVGSIWIMNHLHYNMSVKDVKDKIASDEGVYQIDGEQIGTCPGATGTKHMIELKNNVATPRHTDAKLCDTLIIVNLDNATHEIRFGSEEKPATYAGENGKTLRQRRNLVLTLTELGTHQFHDPILDGISGDFTVAQ
jgi:cytochrome o ubiquinol oxidase subunit IV